MDHQALPIGFRRIVVAGLTGLMLSASTAVALAQATPAPSPAASAVPETTPTPATSPMPAASPMETPSTAPAAAPTAAASPKVAAQPSTPFGGRITINVAPVYLFSSNGDGTAPPPPGFAGVGYTRDNPTASSLQVDYGIAFAIAKSTTLSFSHGNVGYQLGRILTAIPNTALVTGALYDYTDTIALSQGLGHGLAAHVTYFNHQRRDVTGLCLNQKACPDANGNAVPNPLSIDERGYTVGGSYDFGPKTRIGPLMTLAVDAKYVPRPSTPSSPNVALGGLGSYVGSQWMYPYSLTVKVPVLPSTTVTPFINWTNLPVLYRDSAVPEAYRGVVFGLVKVFSPNVTFSYTNLNLQSCRCIARVPPPDNLRLAFGILKLDFHITL
jgi:hypothetical protein